MEQPIFNKSQGTVNISIDRFKELEEIERQLQEMLSGKDDRVLVFDLETHSQFHQLVKFKYVFQKSLSKDGFLKQIRENQSVLDSELTEMKREKKEWETQKKGVVYMLKSIVDFLNRTQIPRFGGKSIESQLKEKARKLKHIASDIDDSIRWYGF